MHVCPCMPPSASRCPEATFHEIIQCKASHSSLRVIATRCELPSSLRPWSLPQTIWSQFLFDLTKCTVLKWALNLLLLLSIVIAQHNRFDLNSTHCSHLILLGSWLPLLYTVCPSHGEFLRGCFKRDLKEVRGLWAW